MESYESAKKQSKAVFTSLGKNENTKNTLETNQVNLCSNLNVVHIQEFQHLKMKVAADRKAEERHLVML